MKINNIPFSFINWDVLPSHINKGETGETVSKIFEKDNFRARLIEYSVNYKADHWCSKGHNGLILDGDLTIKINDGREFLLKQGMSFVVADDFDIHQVFSVNGAKVFIID